MIITQRYDNERPVVGFDTETDLFGPGNMAPQVVCFSFAWRDEPGAEPDTMLLDRRDGIRELRDLLLQAIDGKITIAGHNLPYDVAASIVEAPDLLPLWRRAFEAGAVHCTLAGEWLNDTALGLLRVEWNEEKGEYSTKKSYALENLSRIYLFWPPFKDEWRLRYIELLDVPIRDYPEAAAIYPKRDALATLLITEKQREIARTINPHDPLVANLAQTCRNYLALHLVSCWGEEIDPERVLALNEVISKYADGFVPTLEEDKLVLRSLRGKNAGKLTKKKKRLLERVAQDLMMRRVVDPDNFVWPGGCDKVEELIANPADYLDPKEHDDWLTDGGKSGNRQLKASAEILSDAHDPLLKTMAGFLEAEKLRTSFGKPLLQFGRGPLHSRYGWAETGRTTASGGAKNQRSGLNIQQLPRAMPKKLIAMMMDVLGEAIDVRSCFVPRPGFVQSSTDYSALEMCTFAEVLMRMVGWSSLREALNADIDPHTLFATDLLHCSYEDAIARVHAEEAEAVDMRQRSKVGNFGFPGGMGAKKFVKYAKGQNVILSLAEAYALHQGYRDRWSETPEYFELVGDIVGDGDATIVQFGSDRVHGGCRYTDACNSFFQSLAADGATEALWFIVMECYDETLGSALFGSRVTAFIHDEYRAEHPEECAHEAAERLAQIARDTMQSWLPTVDMSKRAEPALMRRWWKKAKTVRDKHGRLQVWEPKKEERAAA